MSDITPEQQILSLKARLFDVQELAQQHYTNAEQYKQALAQIANALGVTGEEIKLKEIIDAAEAHRK